jgi:hypothetical protein
MQDHLSRPEQTAPVDPTRARKSRVHPIGLALIIDGGSFSIAGAYFNWDWFMNSRKARPIVAIFGRAGARIFYALIGVALTMLGLLFAIGVLK